MEHFEHLGPNKVPTKTRFNEEPQFQKGLYDISKGIYARMAPNGSWGESNAGLITGKFLRPGDQVELKVEKIGVLRNVIRARCSNQNSELKIFRV